MADWRDSYLIDFLKENNARKKWFTSTLVLLFLGILLHGIFNIEKGIYLQAIAAGMLIVLSFYPLKNKSTKTQTDTGSRD